MRHPKDTMAFFLALNRLPSVYRVEGWVEAFIRGWAAGARLRGIT